MTKFAFEGLALSGAYLITPFYAPDNRGNFIKDYSIDVFQSNGISFPIKEIFYATSKRGVVRGLHFQKIKRQPKLVRCLQGEIYDVIVDVRKDSPTYLKWQGFTLNETNHQSLLIPEGFAHGYMVMKDALVCYKCGETFYPEGDGGFRWNDPTISVKWPMERIGGIGNVILSEKDKSLPSFLEFDQAGY